MRLVRELAVIGLIVAASSLAAPAVAAAAQPRASSVADPAQVQDCALDDPGTLDDCIGAPLTNDERALLGLMEPQDRARYLLQKRITDKARTTILLAQLQNARHVAAMRVITGIR
jgi:hypothetical protein